MNLDFEHLLGVNSCLGSNMAIFLASSDASETPSAHPPFLLASGGTLIVSESKNPSSQELIRGDDKITALCVSNDSELIAVGQRGPRADVSVYHRSGSLIRRFQSHDSSVSALCFSCDDKYLLSSGDAGDPRLFAYDIEAGCAVASASLSLYPIASLASGGYVKDVKRRDTSSYLFGSCGGRTTVLWEFDGKVLRPAPITTPLKQSRECTCLVFSSDKEVLFVGTSTGDVVSVLVKSGVVQGIIGAVSGGVGMVACVGKNSLLVGGGDGAVVSLEISHTSLTLKKRLVLGEGGIKGISVCGFQVLVSTSLGAVYRVKIDEADNLLYTHLTSSSATQLCHLSYPKGFVSDIFAVGEDAVLWNLDNWSPRVIARGVKGRWGDVYGDLCLVGGEEGKVSGWDLDGLTSKSAPRRLWTLNAATQGTSTCGKISKNSKFFATGSATGEVRLWDLKTKTLLTHLKEHTMAVTSLNLSSDDRFAISSSRDRCVMGWDLIAEKRVSTHRGKHGGVNCSVFANNLVIAATQEKTIVFYDLRVSDPVRVVGLSDEPTSVSFWSDTIQEILGFSVGKGVGLMDVGTGRVMSSAIAGCDVGSVVYAPDGKQMAAIADDHCIWLWNVFPDN